MAYAPAYANGGFRPSLLTLRLSVGGSGGIFARKSVSPSTLRLCSGQADRDSLNGPARPTRLRPRLFPIQLRESV